MWKFSWKCTEIFCLVATFYSSSDQKSLRFLCLKTVTTFFSVMTPNYLSAHVFNLLFHSFPGSASCTGVASGSPETLQQVSLNKEIFSPHPHLLLRNRCFSRLQTELRAASPAYTRPRFFSAGAFCFENIPCDGWISE